jgi:hypothetical protein
VDVGKLKMISKQSISAATNITPAGTPRPTTTRKTSNSKEGRQICEAREDTKVIEEVLDSGEVVHFRE